MDINSPIPARERDLVRELAKKQLGYAKLPVMAERKRLWTLHNRLEGERPMVVMEAMSFAQDIMPKLNCQHPLAARMEWALSYYLCSYELFDDDKVVPDFFPVFASIGMDFLGQKQKKTVAEEGVGYHIEPLFETLEEGLPLLRQSEFTYDRETTETFEKAVTDVLGDILPPVRKNEFYAWCFIPTMHMVNMMGMENMYCSMMTEPENFHRLMELVTGELLRLIRWQEEEGLLFPNNGNDIVGSGSICFSDELPSEPATGQGKFSSKGSWGHLNSQESIGISPEQFNEFIYPYYEKIAREFGLLYYGCCEPVHAYWDKSLKRLPNLRKISISAWCDEEFMAERLSSSRVIYSRKPSPNFIGIKAEFDEEAFSAYIKKTADAIKGRCKGEFIFRDIYTLHGNQAKVRKAVDITRSIAETIY
jgi:hypothetical protein